MLKGLQAYAAIKGRDYVIPEDVKYLSQFCMPHRLTIRGVSSYIKSAVQESVIKDILEKVAVPPAEGFTDEEAASA
jgi:MoxR-like ATPase